VVEREETNRPYRFGVIWAILNVLGGAYYTWLSVARAENGIEAGFLVFSALIAFGTGMGLLQKRGYGLHFLNLSLLVANVNEIRSWLAERSLDRALSVVALLLLTVLLEIYFQKRARQFQWERVRWLPFAY